MESQLKIQVVEPTSKAPMVPILSYVSPARLSIHLNMERNPRS